MFPSPEVQGRFERVEELLLILRGKTQTLTSAQSTFVWRPGGTASGNVYTSFDALFAAAGPAQGPRWIQFDPTFAPCTLPAGKAYDFGPLWNTIFIAPTIATVTIPAGTTIHGVSRFDSITLVYSGGGVAQTVGSGDAAIIALVNGASFTSSGGGTVLRTAAGAGVEVILGDISTLASGTCIDAVGAGAFCEIFPSDLAGISADTIAQSGGGSLVVVPAPTNATITLAQSGMPNGVLSNTATMVATDVQTFGSVTSQLPGSNSSVATPLIADFTAPDGLAHVAAAIPIAAAPAAPAGLVNNGHRFDVFVTVVSSTGFVNGSYRVKAQNIGGVISATAVTQNDFDDVGATGFTVSVAVVGTNVQVTTTSAAGAVTSVSVQDISGVK